MLKFGYFFLNIFLIFWKETLCTLASLIFENSFFPLIIFATPQSRWLITISFFILCILIEVSKFSQKTLCHFLNLLAVTPIADPAIEKALYFPANFFFFLNDCE